MEKEISKIKIEYQSLTPPKFLMDEGVSNLWNRVDNEKREPRIYFARFAILGIAVLILFSGFIGISSAQSKPGSVLYPVKTLTKKAKNAISNTYITDIYKSQIKHAKTPKTSRPAPTPSPTPTLKLDNKFNKNEDETTNKNNESENKNGNITTSPNQNQNPMHEDVKGVSISGEDIKSNTKTSENSHGGNDNSKKDEIRNNSSENNDSQNHNNEKNNKQ